MRITREMVNEFNKMLENLDCVFRLGFDDGMHSNPHAEIVLANKRFVQSSIINPTDEFYNILETFFKKRDIELVYNNTCSIFWSKSGWEGLIWD